jgi:hypothetical protein
MVKRHLAGLIVAAVVVGGGATAWAAAPDASSGSTPSAPSRPTKEQVKACRDAKQAGQEPSAECRQLRQQAGRRGRPGPGDAIERRMVHGDLIVRGKDGTFENVTVDKGTVDSKGDNSLTLKRADGKTVTLKVDANTKFKGVENFAAVQTGQPAIVVSHDGTARLVGQRAPGGNKQSPSNVGA